MVNIIRLFLKKIIRTKCSVKIIKTIIKKIIRLIISTEQGLNNNKLKVGYIPTKEQLADGFTKGLDNIKQQNMINNININKLIEK